MRRFVIEGFCGSESGAAWPLRSVLGTALPFCVVGRDSGDPMTDEVCDAGGEGCALSDARLSRVRLTVAIAQEIAVGCVAVQATMRIA